MRCSLFVWVVPERVLVFPPRSCTCAGKSLRLMRSNTSAYAPNPLDQLALLTHGSAQASAQRGGVARPGTAATSSMAGVADGVYGEAVPYNSMGMSRGIAALYMQAPAVAFTFEDDISDRCAEG